MYSLPVIQILRYRVIEQNVKRSHDFIICGRFLTYSDFNKLGVICSSSDKHIRNDNVDKCQ